MPINSQSPKVDAFGWWIGTVTNPKRQRLMTWEWDSTINCLTTIWPHL